MSERIYQWLLRFYPEAFRREFGDEARQLFRDRLQNERGVRLRSRLWFDLAMDYGRSLVHEHSRLKRANGVQLANGAGGAPQFCLLNDATPEFGSLFIGAACSLVLLAGFSFLLGPTTSMHGAAFPFLFYPPTTIGYVKPINISAPRQIAVWANADYRQLSSSRRRPALPQYGFQPLQTKSGQSISSTPRPEFEVASVHPAPAGRGGPSIVISPGGRLTAQNVTLKRLIRWAYRLQDFQIEGGPPWIDSAKYDIVARASGDAPRNLLAQMLRSLLQDRFKLQLHTQTKELAITALEIGRDGIKMQRAVSGGDGPSHVAMRPCGLELAFPAGATMGQLANFLSGQSWSERPILDRTRLDGVFDFNLQWTPDGPISLVDGGFESGAPPPPPPPSSSDSPCPSRLPLAVALERQLGLKLSSEKGPVEIMAVDHAEKPAENQDTAAPPAFEVAAIKPSGQFRAGFGGAYSGPSIGGLLNVANASVKSMIAFAYGIRESQIADAPTWMGSDQFDVNAKMEQPSIRDPLARLANARLMFRTLLHERFKLRFHRNTREESGYELVVAKSGLRLRAAVQTSLPTENDSAKTTLAIGMLCNGSIRGPDGKPLSTISAHGQPVSRLTSCLADTLHSTVVDKTGLAGLFDFTVTGYERPDSGMSVPAETSLPSIFDALQNQLGLRLVSARVPVEVFVIDSIERPAPR